MSMDVYVAKLTAELNLAPKQILAVSLLLEDGSTVPFIARYRKEATGGIDEVAILAIRDRLEQLRELDKRRDAILKSIDEQGKLTPELKKTILAAETLARLEDIYLPYKPKRRTRGTMAKERGLEPLATKLFAQEAFDVEAEAATFVDAEKEVETTDAALAGARDIIAEWISEDAELRSELRELYETRATLASHVIKTKAETPEAAKFKDYFDWSEPAKGAPSHRILAVRRGAKEGFLAFHIQPEQDDAIARVQQRYLKASSPAADQVRLAAADSYKRLLSLSMETEMRLMTKKRADIEAIGVFAANLRELLLASPLGQKSVLALDPGFRTGCKLVCLNPQGKLLHHDTIYPHTGQQKAAEAVAKLMVLVDRYNIDAIAIGNGTAGRETLKFCEAIPFPRTVAMVMVNESGASIYSASEVAREEFPDHDLTVRGSVSIGRRLMDPLAELVKLDPKSIGVGQYQHDVDQRQLKTSLDDVIESCVNAVGVDTNTASKELLSHISGLSERIAGNVVTMRNENGPFASRKQLLKVPGMGPKTYEQAAGFLRIPGGANPLDASAVHPESYAIVEQMAADLGCTVPELIADEAKRKQIQLSTYVTDTVGLPTLNDIMAELQKPGRDPREAFQVFSFAEGVNEMTDLTVGMKLPGVVTNVTNFGAFVDIGVHQDGLVHISQLADKFIENPHDVVKVQQKVQVTVMEVDIDRKRIALSMRANPDAAPKRTGGGGDRKPAAKRPPQQQRREEPTDRNNPFGDLLAKFKQ
ncbi:MAG: RNA-binding transcriptional accessory protein [Phycisphaerales bacterium]|jgi:protein Tex|nr:RNA-binding transcriptional accessory protein [Phycisphaerales bacterium]